MTWNCPKCGAEDISDELNSCTQCPYTRKVDKRQNDTVAKTPRKMPRRIYNTLPFNIEEWQPNKLTHRGMFLTIILLANLFLNGILLVVYTILINNNRLNGLGYILYALIWISFLGLAFVWFRYKWAFWLAFGSSICFCLLALVVQNWYALVQTVIATTVFGLTVKGHWWPRQIPDHIKEKWKLPNQSLKGSA